MKNLSSDSEIDLRFIPQLIKYLKSLNYSLVDTSFIGEPIDHDIPSPSIPLNHGFGLSSNDGGYHHQQTHNDKHIDILRPFKPQKDTGRGKGNVGSRVNHPRKICNEMPVISPHKILCLTAS